ncbi:WD-40 repeat protein [Parafrankia sp. EAN1pec]|uniref:TIR domain-containing protein n=1 Tax=Parafrankia sp. (strain EAN1pec) TaxID=298653 RepID=UPI000054242A|nr:WD-40 repeat protein [Frankia sp. EAN1pec]
MSVSSNWGRAGSAHHYDAFISYTEADVAIARELERAIASHVSPDPRLKSPRVFRDRTKLTTAPRLAAAIEQALDRSEYFVLVASPDVVHSRWVRLEIEAWQRRDYRFERLLVVLAGEDLRTSLPGPLRAFYFPERVDSTGDARHTPLELSPNYLSVKPVIRSLHKKHGRRPSRPGRLSQNATEEEIGEFESQRQKCEEWDQNASSLITSHDEFAASAGEITARLYNVDKDELDQAKIREERKKKRKRRWLRVISATATAGILSLVVILLALRQEAGRQRSDADQKRAVARSEQLAQTARALLETSPNTARQISLAAYDVAPTATARSAMMAAGREPGTIDARSVGGLRLSPDGRLLAIVETATTDNVVRLWNLATHRVAATVTGHRGKVNAVAFSPDGRLFATAGDDHTARIWSVADAVAAREVNVLRPGLGPLTALDFGAANQLVLGSAQIRSVASDPTSPGREIDSATSSLQAWVGVEGRNPVGGPVLTMDGGNVTSVDVAPEGGRLVVHAGATMLWDVGPTSMITGGPLTLPGTRDTDIYADDRQDLDGDGFADRVACFTTGGRVVVSGPQVFDVGAGTLVRAASPLGASQDSPLAAACDSGVVSAAPDIRGVRVWSTPANDAGALVARPIPDLGEAHGATAVLSTEGDLLAFAEPGGAVRLIDIRDPARLGRVQIEQAEPRKPDPGMSYRSVRSGERHSSRNGTLAVIMDDSSTTVSFGVWDYSDSAHPRRTGTINLPSRSSPVPPSISDDGRRLAMSNTVNAIDIFGLDDQDALVHIGRYEAFGAQIPGAPGARYAPIPGTFSANGRIYAAPVTDGPRSIQLWEVHEDRLTAVSTVPTAGEVLALDDEGDMLAVADTDGTVRLWDLRDIQAPALYVEFTALPDRPVTELRFTGGDDAGMRVGVTQDDTVSWWAVSQDALVDDLCAEVGDLLSADEWRRLIADVPARRPCAAPG